MGMPIFSPISEGRWASGSPLNFPVHKALQLPSCVLCLEYKYLPFLTCSSTQLAMLDFMRTGAPIVFFNFYSSNLCEEGIFKVVHNKENNK